VKVQVRLCEKMSRTLKKTLDIGSQSAQIAVAAAAAAAAFWLPQHVPAADSESCSRYTETVVFDDGRRISFDMVLVPGGTFVMGSAAGDPRGRDDERPARRVRLRDFYLCDKETTLELFLAYYEQTTSARNDKKNHGKTSGHVDAITGPTLVYGDITMGYSPRHPAVGMTWHNAANFCLWLSAKTGRKYRLPTEAEWEYACRKGIAGCGNDPNRIGDFAWYKANSGGQTHPVGLKKPDSLGIHDMLGNVLEWTSDFYSTKAYNTDPNEAVLDNPSGPAGGTVHVARGGDYTSGAADLRCAARSFEEKGWRSGDPQIPKSTWWLPQMDFIGLRVAAGTE